MTRMPLNRYELFLSVFIDLEQVIGERVGGDVSDNT